MNETLLEYQAMLDNTSLGIAFSRRRTFLRCNHRFSELFGWNSAELIGQSTAIVHPSEEAYEAWIRTVTPVLRTGQRVESEVLLKRRDGGIFWGRLMGRLVDPDDRDKGAIFVTEDITERKLAYEAQRRLLLEYQATLDNASLGIVFVRDMRTHRCNQRFTEMFGWTAEELAEQEPSVLYSSLELYQQLLQQARRVLGSGERFEVEALMRRRDGGTFWCRMLAKAIDPSDPGNGVIYITEDVTERRNVQEALRRAHDELELRVQQRTAELATANARLQAEIRERQAAEEQIRYLANHDALTGLPNRRLLQDRLEQALHTARRHQRQVAVQFIDLDHFKPINDSYGHRVGDLLLQAVGVRLRCLLRGIDTVARVGGDEFVLVLPDVSSAQAALEIGNKVLTALLKPYTVEGQDLTISPSIGISMFPEHGEEADALLCHADTAMYHAKECGRGNVQLFQFPDKR